MKRIFFLIGFICFVSVSTHAQIMFQRHYGGGGDDGALCIQQTSDGGYIVVGNTYSFGSGLADVYIIKTNSYGDTLWTKSIGGIGSDEGYVIKNVLGGGFIICGYTTSFGAGNSDVYLIKINDYGDTLWTKTYGGIGSESGWDIIQTSDSGFIITGSTSSLGSGDYAALIIKTDSLGNEEFTNFFEINTSNIANEIIATIDNNYLIIGTTFNASTVNSKDCFVAKIDNSGDTLWTKKYGGISDDWGNAIAETSDGNYIIMGSTASFGSGGTDVFISKIDSDGAEIWTKAIGGTGNETSGSIELCADLNFIITCATDSYGAGGKDCLLVKIDGNGDTLWTKCYGYSVDEIGVDIRQTNDNGFIVAGYTSSFGSDYDVFLVKTNMTGFAGINQQYLFNSSFSYYPNPCTDVLNIKMFNEQNRFVEVAILGLDGKIMFKENVEENASFEKQINLSNFPPGLYLLQITNSEQISIVKIQVK